MAKDQLHLMLTEFYEHAMLAETAAQRLSLLQAMSARRVHGRQVSRKARLKLRRKFVRARRDDFARVAGDDWRPCFVCWHPSNHRHHIVMLHLGGDNRHRNVAWVCSSCHQQIHPWMQELKETKPRAPRLVKKSAAEVDALMSPRGGWTREALTALGVPWPPQKGWRKRLLKQDMTPRLVRAESRE